VLSELGRGQPSTVQPYRPPGGLFWRILFVPLYRRLPWTVKERAMGLLGMTAKGWQPPARKPGEPWRPPSAVPPAPAERPGPGPGEPGRGPERASGAGDLGAGA
jgi:hypothetical protein